MKTEWAAEEQAPPLDDAPTPLPLELPFLVDAPAPLPLELPCLEEAMVISVVAHPETEIRSLLLHVYDFFLI